MAPRAFAVAGVGGVPATQTLGVTGNLTVTGQTTGGYAFPGPTATPSPSTSTINVPLGDNRADGIDVGLAGDGTLGAVWVGTSLSSTTAMIEPGNPADLALQIERLVDDPGRRLAHTSGAGTFVREHSWDHDSRDYLALLERLSRKKEAAT